MTPHCLQCGRMPLPAQSRFCSPSCAMRYGKAHPHITLEDLASAPCQCIPCVMARKHTGDPNASALDWDDPRYKPPGVGPPMTRQPLVPVRDFNLNKVLVASGVQDLGLSMPESDLAVARLVAQVRMKRGHHFLHIGPGAWDLIRGQLEVHPGVIQARCPDGPIYVGPGAIDLEVIINPELALRWHFAPYKACTGLECRGG